MNAKELRDLFASGRAYVACDGERLIDEATAREADAIAARALGLLAAAEGGDGTPETDACADWNARCERIGDNEIITHGLMLALAHDEGDELRLLARRLERERNALAARVRELEAEIVRLCKLPRESFTKHLNLSHDQRAYSWHEIQYLLGEWGREQEEVLVRLDPKTKSTGSVRGK